MLNNAITLTSATPAAPVKPDAVAVIAAASGVAAAPALARDVVLTTEQAIATANRAMRTLAIGLEFSVDPESSQVVVRVVDSATQQIIRQLPSEEMLAVARGIDRVQGLLLNRRA